MRKISCLFLGLVLWIGLGTVAGQTVELIKLPELERKLSGGSETVVVNFWATWCAPCVKELPYFQKLQDKYVSSSVKVMLVSLDGRPMLEKKVVPFITKSGITADFYLLDETNQQEYIDRIDSSWSGALPATLIVNANNDKRLFIEGEVTFEQLEDAIKEVR